MGALSGSGIDKMLYPDPYKSDYKDSRQYGREAGAATGAPGGAASGSLMANRDMRDRLALSRIQAQQQQGAAYGQMFQQLAMLAAYMRAQRGVPTSTDPGAPQGSDLGPQNMFGVFNQTSNAPTQPTPMSQGAQLRMDSGLGGQVYRHTNMMPGPGDMTSEQRAEASGQSPAYYQMLEILNRQRGY